MARYEKSLNSFSARTSSLNRKSIPFSQFLLPVPCKRSSTVPIPFGFRLSVARSHCFVNLCAMLFYRHCPIRTPASIPALPWTTICAVVTLVYCATFIFQTRPSPTLPCPWGIILPGKSWIKMHRVAYGMKRNCSRWRRCFAMIPPGWKF